MLSLDLFESYTRFGKIQFFEIFSLLTIVFPSPVEVFSGWIAFFVLADWIKKVCE